MSSIEQIKNEIEQNLPCCDHSDKKNEQEKPHSKKDRFLGISIIIGAAIIGGSWVYNVNLNISNPESGNPKEIAELEKNVLPAKGVILPVKWGDLGKRMIENGVIDQKKFENLYAQRGGIDEETKKLLSDANNGQIKITKDNANTVLNLLWALGLANKNEILEKGPMTDKKYSGDAGRFASTGGWTLATGNPMDHYSRHALVPLTPEQQALVEKVSQNIYRPCCGNSTHFPDCNHGMAMLGLLELMASQGLSEEEMYKAALVVNAYWFPDTYLTIAKYLETKGLSWSKTEPRALLGANFSSARGYRQILNQVSPPQQRSSGSCGV